MGEGRPSGNRLSVYEAADELGLTVDAIRKRVSRGTIPHEKDEDGRVWVLLDADRDMSGNIRDTDRPRSDSGTLTAELRDRLHYVEGQLEAERQAHAEARRIIAGLVERIPAIEAPTQEPAEGPVAATEEAPGGSDRPDSPGPERPWWRRWFGG